MLKTTMNFDKIVGCKNMSKGRSTCEYIVLHHTAGGSFDGNLSVLSGERNRVDAKGKEVKVSCHYLIGEKSVAKIAEDENILWHAGESQWEGRHGMNFFAIGIEIIDKAGKFNQYQKDKVRELIKELMSKHNIPSARIIRHKDISPGRKIDPYDTLRNGEYKTFKDYQNSFGKALSSENDKIAQEAIDANGKLWNATKNEQLRVILQETNAKIRSFRGSGSI